MTRWRIDESASEVRVRAMSTLHGSESKGTIRGVVQGDLGALEDTAGGELVIPVSAQKFGSRMQDFAMARHLNVKRFPTATFVISRLEVTEREPLRIRITGELQYQRCTTITVEATGTASERLVRAESTFPLSLSAIGVKPPKLGFLRVDDTVQVSVRLVARTMN